MKRRIYDVIIGQILMAIMLIIGGIVYEGIGYSDLSDIMPYIKLAGVLIAISVVPSIVLFKTGIELLGYFRTKKEEKVEVIKDVEIL